jgi:hypothetical protein
MDENVVMLRKPTGEPPRRTVFVFDGDWSKGSLFISDTCIASGDGWQLFDIAKRHGLKNGDRYLLQLPGKEIEMESLSSAEHGGGKSARIAVRDIPRAAPILPMEANNG